jgi:hypothetical protein
MLSEYEIVFAKRDLDDCVSKGTKGVVLIILRPGLYEVEFVDERNDTVGLLEVKEEDVVTEYPVEEIRN